MSTQVNPQSNNRDFQFRRRFPRRNLDKLVGVLHKGEYFVGKCAEIGEGGISFNFPKPIDANEQLVVTLYIPGGSLVSLKATVRNFRDDGQSYVMGCSYNELPFEVKRQIRTYVSSRMAAHN